MAHRHLIPVLGHARVLEDAPRDERRRVVAYEGDAIVGVGAFEPLFGPHAEGVIAIRDGDSPALLPYLLDELLERVHTAGLVAVRFVFADRTQLRTAEHLSNVRTHCALRRDWLDVRLEPVPAPDGAAA
jgi:hypothetical protein